MRFEIDKKELERILFKTHGICSSRNITNNILTNIRISARNSQIDIRTTDRNLSLISTANANVQESGEIIVNGRKMYEAIKELPNNIVVLEKNENILNIACRKTNFKLLSTDAELYPDIDIEPSVDPIEISVSVLRNLITKTVFCSCEGQSRYGINGILILIRQNELQAVATDGHRLGIASLQTTTDAQTDNEVIIPRNSIQEILKLLQETSEKVYLYIEENSLILKTHQDMFKSNILKKKFPPYEKVIPSKLCLNLQMNTQDIRETLKRLAIFTSEHRKVIKFSIDDQVINASIQSPEYGNAKESIDIESDSDSRSEIGYNHKMLSEIISAIDTQKVAMKFNEGLSVSMITPVPGETESPSIQYTYILMPNRF